MTVCATLCPSHAEGAIPGAASCYDVWSGQNGPRATVSPPGGLAATRRRGRRRRSCAQREEHQLSHREENTNVYQKQAPADPPRGHCQRDDG